MKNRRFDHITDAELLQYYYEEKDQQWIGLLLERYTLLLLGVCMKYLKNEEEAKDSVQQIFLKALTELGKYRVDYFKSWLYMVAKNHCLMKIRAKGGKEVLELCEHHITTPEENTRQHLIENEKNYMLLEEAINELCTEQQQCIILFYLQKNSYSQISERTGYSLLQVKSYIQNGKRNLKLLLEKKAKQPIRKEP
ncbi:MAG: sigma-70 family RNA polymerase sigma factor [Flavisolibacter sp.]|nr:sigma-70 family RNA polymerase sigma factor [Flavisolibacter sp.]MBD0374376.1 sigma-70 family RNA polymerase sigma factor [Flavisolibacter sp.]